MRLDLSESERTRTTFSQHATAGTEADRVSRVNPVSSHFLNLQAPSSPLAFVLRNNREMTPSSSLQALKMP